MICKEHIQRTIRKLENDAIFPYASLRPTLAVIHESFIEGSGEESYLKSLQAAGKRYGAIVNDYIADTPIEVSQITQLLAVDPNIHGIIIISDYGYMNRTLYNLIPVRLDIDGLSSVSLGNLQDAISPIAYRQAPCTAVACMKIMEEMNDQPDFSGQCCLILGRSIRVGRPLAEILTQKNMTVTLAHSRSPEKFSAQPTTIYDYVVSAIGKPNYWNEEHPIYIRSYTGTNIIDVGMNVDEDGKLCGDVDREWISNLIQKDKYSYDNLLITPVVGGVGKVIGSPGDPSGVQKLYIGRETAVLLVRVVRAEARLADDKLHAGRLKVRRCARGDRAGNVNAFDCHAHSSFLGSV